MKYNLYIHKIQAKHVVKNLLAVEFFNTKIVNISKTYAMQIEYNQ